LTTESQTPQQAYLLTSGSSLMSGQAGRHPAVKATPAILTATIQITRASTGKVEEYQLIGTAETPKD